MPWGPAVHIYAVMHCVGRALAYIFIFPGLAHGQNRWVTSGCRMLFALKTSSTNLLVLGFFIEHLRWGPNFEMKTILGFCIHGDIRMKDGAKVRSVT